MQLKKVNETFSVSEQLDVADIETLKAEGVSVLICNRPDGEASEQTPYDDIARAAKEAGMEAISLPFRSGELTEDIVDQFSSLISARERTHAYCRTGNRSFCVFAASEAKRGKDRESLLALGNEVGFDIRKTIDKYYSGEDMTESDSKVEVDSSVKSTYDVVIIGAGSGGIAVAASLRKRKAGLRIAVIDPSEEHFYQPGWTMVGGGVFDVATTRRETVNLIPSGVSWIKNRAARVVPQSNEVQLEDGSCVCYGQLIVAPGLVLDWDAVKGLKDALGKEGVTSNYTFKTAPYTHELVKGLKKGRAIFTQPPMPIKCAGAPQKALYLSADYWRRANVLSDIDVQFYNAGGVLFGVADYVPALQSYIDRYGATVNYNHNLCEIDADNKLAYFKHKPAEGEEEIVSTEYDMIHVCPPQCAPAFIAESGLADGGGWLDVNQFSLRHNTFDNIWGLGDVMNTPNAKTMAAVRKQVPVVADNLCAVLDGKEIGSGYDGYGSCPLTVENGKIVLAEFGYGGKLLPTFPTWMLEGTKPTHRAWVLKASILPGIYWNAMLKGHEWLAGPQPLSTLQN